MYSLSSSNGDIIIAAPDEVHIVPGPLPHPEATLLLVFLCLPLGICIPLALPLCLDVNAIRSTEVCGDGQGECGQW